jgi:hypothetical protein
VRSILMPGTHDISLSKAPWVGWQVDNEFLKKLHEWNVHEPQSTAIRVMKNVQEKLSKFADLAESEVVKEAMELIPNDPFPAGTLVKALLNVLVIGVVSFHVVLIISSYSKFCQRIPEVKQEAFDFAVEVVQDINRMAEAYGSATNSDNLLMESWNLDLQEMKYSIFTSMTGMKLSFFRCIVDEVCRWASETIVWIFLL